MWLTVYSCFHLVLKALTAPDFYARWVAMPNADAPQSDNITQNYQYRDYFHDCIGGIDGTLITAFPPVKEAGPYRTRKSGLAMNCLLAFDFDGRIIYCNSGWEGSAHYWRIYEAAREVDLVIPPGKYFLGDSGFNSRKHCMIPFDATRYHLKEWELGRRGYVQRATRGQQQTRKPSRAIQSSTCRRTKRS